MLMFVVVLGFVLTLHEARAQTSRAGHFCVGYLLNIDSCTELVDVNFQKVCSCHTTI